MLRNYLLVAFRTLARDKIYAGINIVGLALALACSLVLLLYVRSELSYDQHFEDHERIVRVTYESTAQGRSRHFAISSRALAPLFNREYPDTVDFVRFFPSANNLVKANDAEFYWDTIKYADPKVFEVFSHHAVFGELENALDEPLSIAISRSMAERYFGESNPVGETLETDIFNYKITAVFEDLPDNTHLKYDALISYKTFENFGLNDDAITPRDLFGISDYTYARLAPGISKDRFQFLLDEYREQHVKSISEEIEIDNSFHVQALKDIHFGPSVVRDEPTGNIFYVYGFIMVALFVLAVACINYMNLATARATKRAKEVGMRKVIGANRSQLIIQFVGESFAYVFIALLLALALVEIAQRFTELSTLLGKTSLLDIHNDAIILVWIIIGAFLVALASAAHPAFYLSSITPLAAINSSIVTKSARIQLRQVLVFIQFFISIGVVSGTILMGLQMQYLASKSLGFDKENKLIVQLRGVDVLEKLPLIRNELLRNSKVRGVAETSFTPKNLASWAVNVFDVENNEGEFERSRVNHIAVGDDFIGLMGIEVVQGRSFSTEFLKDNSNSILVNETMVSKLGWDEGVGKRIKVGDAEYQIVGIVKDFNFESLHKPVDGLMLRPFPTDEFANLSENQRKTISRSVIISIGGENVADTIKHIESVIGRFDPSHPFEFSFLDDMLNELYLSESNLIKLTWVFAFICILISCLGLFGLATFTTARRTKEIGIRKVLGASTFQIIELLARSQLILILVASVFASITCYLVISEWLTVFAYKTDIKLWVFTVSSLAVAAVAFITVTLQSGKTARSNPVDALRYE
ncbi:ABC transporter permease [Aurantivibrio infirmus]